MVCENILRYRVTIPRELVDKPNIHRQVVVCKGNTCPKRSNKFIISKRCWEIDYRDGSTEHMMVPVGPVTRIEMVTDKKRAQTIRNNVPKHCRDR
jgi:hypothetical protein